jgi:cytochrome c-type biogenesis protein CcsB
MTFSWFTAKSWMSKISWSALLIAFALHVYGFALRVYLTGRAPVSNMYETVVWVAFGSVVFGMIFETIFRKKFILIAAGIVAVLCLIIADMAPAILDHSLQPLEPVLRSNYWLTIHVLTITLSYSAFFLAFVLGNIGLIYFIRGEQRNLTAILEMNRAIYRALQVGVVLLAAGIILGGIWADYSWGRFWGWDPKETWALIALLGYLAILHGRLGGWLRQFGLMAGAIIGFNLVIMAWYGVNYVLGAGLHSYGFGAGGVEYVASFVALNLLYVLHVGMLRYFREKRTT